MDRSQGNSWGTSHWLRSARYRKCSNATWTNWAILTGTSFLPWRDSSPIATCSQYTFYCAQSPILSSCSPHTSPASWSPLRCPHSQVSCSIGCWMSKSRKCSSLGFPCSTVTWLRLHEFWRFSCASWDWKVSKVCWCIWPHRYSSRHQTVL